MLRKPAICRAITAFSLLFSAATLAEPVYIIRDKNGNTCVSPKPTRLCPKRPITVNTYRPWYMRTLPTNTPIPKVRPDKYRDLIASAAATHKLDPALLHAIIQTESGYNPNALSPKGAQGLMQLMPATAKRFGIADAFDPAQNISAGARYLKFLLGLFKGDVILAAAAYNAGEGAVQKYSGIPPYAETQEYVRRVNGLLTAHRKLRK